MKYIDAHCHVHFDTYDPNRDDVLRRMREGDTGGILVGVNKATSAEGLALAEQHNNVWATIGLHPCYVKEESFNSGDYEKLATHPSVVGVGECGLDYFREEDPLVHEKQREEFLKQIHFAVEHDLPLMIHARPSKGTVDAYRDLIDILRAQKEVYGEELRGNIHFFVGGVQEMQDLHPLGFTISVTGVITFTHEYDEVVSQVPRTMLLAETDAPYATPTPHRGKTNEPVFVEHVVARIAELWEMSLEDTQKQLLDNTKRMFGL